MEAAVFLIIMFTILFLLLRKLVQLGKASALAKPPSSPISGGKSFNDILPDFKLTDSYPRINLPFIPVNRTILAFDSMNDQMCVIHNDLHSGLNVKIVNSMNIRSCEIIEDGETVTSVNRGSQIGKAVVGGALMSVVGLGLVGAVVGGVTSKKTTRGTISLMKLRVALDDTTNPFRDVTFIKKTVKRDSPQYKQARAC